MSRVFFVSASPAAHDGAALQRHRWTHRAHGNGSHVDVAHAMLQSAT